MKTLFLSVLAITGLFLASCSNDDKDTDLKNDGEVRFSSGVTGLETRVSGDDGDQWDGNEHIGVYMVNNGQATIAEGADNVEYSTTSTGQTATFTSTTPIYYPADATQKVDFIAYHPYNSSVSNYAYPVDVTNQSNQSAIDLMQAFANNAGSGYDKTNGTNSIALQFQHKLTKVVIVTTPDDGLTQSDLANMTVTIKGLNTKATYRIDTDVLGTPNTVASITTKTITAGALYEAIVVPQPFGADVVTVEFALNNDKDEVFVYKMPAKTFAASQKHTFNVTVQRTKVEVGSTITPWGNGGTTTGVAD